MPFFRRIILHSSYYMLFKCNPKSYAVYISNEAAAQAAALILQAAVLASVPSIFQCIAAARIHVLMRLHIHFTVYVYRDGTMSYSSCKPYTSLHTYCFSLTYEYIHTTAYTLSQGWHYELEDKDAPLTYKGVVFNEMKGVYSSPDSLHGRACQQVCVLMFTRCTVRMRYSAQHAHVNKLTLFST
jgi:hypothetical protein